MSEIELARLFGEIFTGLADVKTGKIDIDEAAKRFWRAAHRHPFRYCQMECDDALVTLGLAKRGIDYEDKDV